MKEEDKKALLAIAVMAGILAVCLHFESIESTGDIIIFSVISTFITVRIYDFTKKERIKLEKLNRELFIKKPD